MCLVTKTTDTRSAYVIRIAFPRQQWFCEKISMLLFQVHSPVFLKLCLVLTSTEKKKTLVTERTDRWLSVLRYGDTVLSKMCNGILFSFNERPGLLHIREIRSSKIWAQSLSSCGLGLWFYSVCPEKWRFIWVFLFCLANIVRYFLLSYRINVSTFQRRNVICFI